MKSSSEKKWKIFMIFHSEKRHSHKGAPSINHHPFGSRENGGRLVGKEWERAEVAEVSVILKKNVFLFCQEVMIVKTGVFFAFLLEHSGTSIISEVTDIKFWTYPNIKDVMYLLLPCSPKIYQFYIWVFDIAFNNLNQPSSKCVFSLYQKGEGVARLTLKKEEIEKEKAQRNS